MVSIKFQRAGFIFFVATCFFSIEGQCQNLKLIETYRAGLKTASPERRFELLNSIGFEYRYSIPDSTIFYCNQALELGKEIKIGRELSRPLSFIGLAKSNQGDYKAALDFHTQALEVARDQRDTLQMAHGYNNLGRIFFDQGDLVRAYSNFVIAKELFEQIGDKSGLAYVYRSLAGLFKSKKDFGKALENSEKALALRKELGDPRAITSAYMELGLVYEDMDTTALALRQFQSADSIATKVNDEISKAELKIGMAEILFHENGDVGQAEMMAKMSSGSFQKTPIRKFFFALAFSWRNAWCNLKETVKRCRSWRRFTAFRMKQATCPFNATPPSCWVACMPVWATPSVRSNSAISTKY
jgi:tetratricopeptide (TPR) repeat protein